MIALDAPELRAASIMSAAPGAASAGDVSHGAASTSIGAAKTAAFDALFASLGQPLPPDVNMRARPLQDPALIKSIGHKLLNVKQGSLGSTSNRAMSFAALVSAADIGNIFADDAMAVGQSSLLLASASSNHLPVSKNAALTIIVSPAALFMGSAGLAIVALLRRRVIRNH